MHHSKTWTPRPSPIRHGRAHEEIVATKSWYSDKPPCLGPAFTVAKTAERTTTLLDILAKKYQAASLGKYLRLEPHGLLWDRLATCSHLRRCGSLACAKCARAV